MNSSAPLAPPSAGPSTLIPSLPVSFKFFKNPKKKQANEPLPHDFQPFPYSVICGRGKACTESVGNRRLKVIASMFLEKYASASNKDEKSAIVSEIIEIISGEHPFREGFIDEMEDRNVRYVVGMESWMTEGLSSEAMDYVRANFEYDNCLWTRKDAG